MIACLRDRGVLIASSNRGYKIPASRDDIRDFALHAQNIVPAMLNRVKRARDDLKMVSMGDFDLLSDPSLADLKKLIDGD